MLKKQYPFLFRIAHFLPPLSSLSPLSSFKSDSVKDENHRREQSALRNLSLVEAESTIRKLERQMKSRTNTTRNINGTFSYNDVRRLEAEVQNLQAENENFEEKLRVREFFIKFLENDTFHHAKDIYDNIIFAFNNLRFTFLY